MKCSKCGFEVEENFKFCAKCGATIETYNAETEKTYMLAISKMKVAKNEEMFLMAAELFTSIKEYKNSSMFALECMKKAEDAKKDTIYKNAINKMAMRTHSGYEEAILLFEQIPEWKDSNERIQKCLEQLNLGSSQSTGSQTSVIIARSESCLDAVLEYETKLKKACDLVLLFFSLVGIFIEFKNYILAILNDENLRFVEGASLAEFTMAAIMIIAGIALSKWAKNKEQPNIERYKIYCKAESLIVDGRKVYGSTRDKKVSLLFEQIKETRIIYQSNSEKRLKNGTLEIVDKQGKRYSFYSFKNCNELRTIINMEVERERQSRFRM